MIIKTQAKNTYNFKILPLVKTYINEWSEKYEESKLWNYHYLKGIFTSVLTKYIDHKTALCMGTA